LGDNRENIDEKSNIMRRPHEEGKGGKEFEVEKKNEGRDEKKQKYMNNKRKLSENNVLDEKLDENNPIHVYLHANLTAQRPITKLARVHRNTQK
jgi:hypothetical protein